MSLSDTSGQRSPSLLESTSQWTPTALLISVLLVPYSLGKIRENALRDKEFAKYSVEHSSLDEIKQHFQSSASLVFRYGLVALASSGVAGISGLLLLLSLLHNSSAVTLSDAE